MLDLTEQLANLFCGEPNATQIVTVLPRRYGGLPEHPRNLKGVLLLIKARDVGSEHLW